MTDEDKQIVIDWIGDMSPKGLLEGTEITADAGEIQDFIDEIHTHLTEMFGT